MKKLILVSVLGAFLTGCGVNVESATSALEAQGITDVKIGGYSWFGCDDKDTFRSSFTGTGANGKPVSGYVCQGIFKGTTVRYD